MDMKRKMVKVANRLNKANYIHTHQNILEMFASGIYPHEIDQSLKLGLGVSSGVIESYMVAMRFDEECQ